MKKNLDLSKIEAEPESDPKPTEIFDGQQPSEEIILNLKRHPMTMYKTGLELVGGALLVVIAYSIFGISAYSTGALVIYLLIGGYKGLMTWYKWWGSHYILTTERVISIDQEGIFHRIVQESPLDKLQNVSYEIKGAYQTFLNYGSVKILTAGQSEADILFKFVPHPYDVQQEMTDAAYKYGNKKINL